MACVDIFERWHQDIKPKNILAISCDPDESRFGYHLKVADLGLSHFERVSGDDSEATTIDNMGTRTYGELHLYNIYHCL